AIKATSPAGQYLVSRGIEHTDFNSYGSRRGNDLVMTRGTFANVRIKNLMVPGTEGGVTKYFGNGKSETGEQMSIFDAAMKYAKTKIPLIIFAGHEYGAGSSRDWAAKGTRLLGVKPVSNGGYCSRSIVRLKISIGEPSAMNAEHGGAFKVSANWSP